MSYGKQERHDENPHRHSNYEFPGGTSEATVKRIAAGGGCPCASGVAHGAVTTEDDIEACFSYPITLENSLTSFVAAPAPSSKQHTVSWSAEDQWWESADIVTNLLASDPEELGDQTYRLRMTMTDPTTNRENVVLILYRVEPEGEDDFEELIPAGAGNPLCVFKNVGFVEPLTGFKLDRFQRVDPDLGLRWSTGCKVCVGAVVGTFSMCSPAVTLPITVALRYSVEEILNAYKAWLVTEGRNPDTDPNVTIVANALGNWTLVPYNPIGGFEWSSELDLVPAALVTTDCQNRFGVELYIQMTHSGVFEEIQVKNTSNSELLNDRTFMDGFQFECFARIIKANVLQSGPIAATAHLEPAS